MRTANLTVNYVDLLTLMRSFFISHRMILEVLDERNKETNCM